MARMTGDTCIAEMLRAYGVTHVFQVPTAFFGVMRAMEHMDVHRVVTHGEKAAAYMADGYARASKRAGICMAQNIGTANLAAGLADAYMGFSPVIAMTGALPTEHRYRHAYQEYEHAPLFTAVTKSSYQVDRVTRLPDMLRQAFREAMSGVPGPVHLDIRDEACSAEADLELVIEEQFRQYPVFRPVPEDERVREAARLIAQAQRPVIVAGSGVIASEAWREVTALAELLTIPVATSLNGKLTLPADHPLNVSVVGRYSAWCANRTVSSADLLIAIGTRLGGMTTWDWRIPAPDMPTIQIGIDPSELGRNYPARVALLGDVRSTVRLLLEALGPMRPSNDRLAEIKTTVEQWRAEYAPLVNSEASPMRPERVIVVNDNHSLNQEKGVIERTYNGQPTEKAFNDLMMFLDVDLAKVAQAIGCYAERIERPRDIGPAMQRAFAAGKIAVLDMVSDIEAMGPVARLADVRVSVGAG